MITIDGFGYRDHDGQFHPYEVANTAKRVYVYKGSTLIGEAGVKNKKDFNLEALARIAVGIKGDKVAV